MDPVSRRPVFRLSLLTFIGLLGGCGEGAGNGLMADLAMGADAQAAGDALMAPDLGTHGLVAARPYMSKIPAGYDPQKPTPLLILLHGYSASGALQDAYFGLSRIVDGRDFLYAYPDGQIDSKGLRYWNADDACCDLDHSGVDDVAYINAVVDDMSLRFNVDPKRIFLAGHSNGAFMAHRLACDSSQRFAAIVALAGDVWSDASRCNPTSPVAVLQIHGDLDLVISYQGGANFGVAYPSARTSVLTWAHKNGCAQSSLMQPAIDLDTLLFGTETSVEQWPACRPGGAAELWTIRGGGHIPNLQQTFAGTIYDWLSAHPKP